MKPGFKAPKQVHVVEEKVQTHESKSFTVMYTKDIKKKIKKRFDGILVKEDNRLTLFDEEGKKIYQGYKNDLEMNNEGSTEMFIGSFLGKHC
jgi:hypothetical protein